MNKIKEIRVEDFLVNINSYLKLADVYVQEHCQNEEVFHLGLMIDKMQEELEKLKPYFSDILR